jgi:plastocyanin
MRAYLSFKRTRFLWAALLLAAALTVVLVACGGQTTTTTPTATTAPTQAPTATPTPAPATVPLGAVIVKMVEKTPGHYTFDPAAITIKAGTVVVWINMSDGKHTVTSDPGAPSAFNTTNVVTQNQTFALMFTTPGTYHYRCTIHPATMKATITVTS